MTPEPRTPAFRDLDPARLAHLLDAAAALGPCRDLETLGPALYRVLQEDLPLHRLALWLGAPDEGLPLSQWAAQSGPDGLLDPVSPLPAWVEATRNLAKDFYCLEQAEACGSGGMGRVLKDMGFRSAVLLPLRTPERLVGGLALASREPGAFQAVGHDYLIFLARFLSSYALRILRLRQLDELNASLTRERDQQRVLLEITNELMAHREPRDLFEAISANLRRHIAYDGLVLVVAQNDGREVEVRFIDFPGSRGHIQENRGFAPGLGPTGRAMELRQPCVFTREDLLAFPPPVPQVMVEGEGLRSMCSVPLISRNRVMGVLSFASRREGAFPPAVADLLGRAGAQVAIALDNAFAYEEIQALRDKLAQENLYLQEEMDRDYGLEIIGNSASLMKVLRQVETVAPSGATVLLLGETGTGKELMARAIHGLSPRAEKSFVQINCAAIPAGLMESELFGHEKGAFTGAISAKAGRLELAHEGTLFLDEVGDLPLELQPKLLRALQEREFERLGGVKPRKVDLRLIAATNQDLAAMVEAKTFRADLFYRLNVFPIRIPPLRERREDIPDLVRYFTQKFAQRMHKPIDAIPARAMEALAAWNWPGNVRELENFIERSVILSPGRELRIPFAELAPARPAQVEGETLRDAERSAILKALEASGGRVGGAAGAAARLGMKRTTLQSRMKKLGIGEGPLRPVG
ncbi:sigma 54-interacting transcriptional regulator [Mesoterricola sediminis]|uniref:ATPase AAA n=1 Tax=Mesoterricola sediminis TaxID=2927980 RepID=A0AA48GPM0_9BACT|nr:sigma 54-interacting transcriptional regulator [Mesoterricola sediminis]BDU76931.1 ATPase AAA [Mesoterricola sediminis]